MSYVDRVSTRQWGVTFYVGWVSTQQSDFEQRQEVGMNSNPQSNVGRTSVRQTLTLKKDQNNPKDPKTPVANFNGSSEYTTLRCISANYRKG